MDTISAVSNNYVDLVQQATKRNTLSQVSESRNSGTPVDVEQIQSSNQQIRDSSRELGVELYSQNLARQAVETYANSSQQADSVYDNSGDSNNTGNVYTFDPKEVNDTLQTAQKRAFGISLYENLEPGNQGNGNGFEKPVPVDVYV